MNEKLSAVDLSERVLAGERAAAARAISWVENAHPEADSLMGRLYPSTGRASVVGITGPPGVGKSTLTAAFLNEALRQGRRTGALLVDPSSPISGGSLMGDRIRLSAQAGDGSVFVRSLASRGAVGGLAASVWGARRILEAMGLDLIFIETVGAGQSDVEIARCADTVVLVLMPGLGDEIQVLKAGILEMADVLVLNKADFPEKERALAALRLYGLPETESGGWHRNVLTSIATRSEGIEKIWRTILEHLAFLERSGERIVRRRRQAEAELMACLQRKTRIDLLPRLQKDIDRLLRRQSDPATIVEKFLRVRTVPTTQNARAMHGRRGRTKAVRALQRKNR